MTFGSGDGGGRVRRVSLARGGNGDGSDGEELGRRGSGVLRVKVRVGLVERARRARRGVSLPRGVRGVGGTLRVGRQKVLRGRLDKGRGSGGGSDGWRA